MTIVVGITGGTCSGKTTSCEFLSQQLMLNGVSTCYLSQDWYYYDLSYLDRKERDLRNFDEPSAIDNDLFLQHVNTLKSNTAVLAPDYDYVEHIRLDTTKTIMPSNVIILDGLFLLSEEEIRKVIDLSVFLTAPDDVRLIRRIRRDAFGLGLPIQYVVDYWESTVLSMHSTFVESSKKYANYIADSINQDIVDALMDLAKST